MLLSAMVGKIAAWRKSQGSASEAEAIRALLRVALATLKETRES